MRESLQTFGIQHVRGQSQLPDERRADAAGREVEKVKQGFLRKSDIGAAALLQEAAKLLLSGRFYEVPVVDDGCRRCRDNEQGRGRGTIEGN